MEKLKIKPLTKEQIIISIDRLTRFKPTEDKYLRVFKDIITANLISPKFKKKELDLIDYSVLAGLIEEIFNYSFEALNCPKLKNFSINKKLLKYEKSIFKLDKNIEKLVDNKIDYGAVIKILSEENNLPLNLEWLKSLTKNNNQVQDRMNLGLKFPVEKVILVEGITEEILLPKFARICGYDFDKAGIHLISAGGKNQVVKSFYQFSDILKIPIFVLLDNDAKENFDEIFPKLRKGDKVHVLECGEFEDLLPLNLIKRTINRHFKNYFTITIDDLRSDLPMTKKLEELFKTYGLEFKKAEFASLVEKNIESEKDASAEICAILREIS